MRKRCQNKKEDVTDKPDDDEMAGSDVSLGRPHFRRRMEGELDSTGIWDLAIHQHGGA